MCDQSIWWITSTSANCFAITRWTVAVPKGYGFNILRHFVRVSRETIGVCGRTNEICCGGRDYWSGGIEIARNGIPRNKRLFLSGWMNQIISERRREWGRQLLPSESPGVWDVRSIGSGRRVWKSGSLRSEEKIWVNPRERNVFYAVGMPFLAYYSHFLSYVSRETP